MINDSQQWQPFDARTLKPLSEDEISVVESACNALNERLNSSVVPEFGYQWNASPLNFADLDYDFYEFGGGQWYQDNGFSFTCAWGQILANSFGFQWMKMEGGTGLRDWVLKSEEAYYVFFPWQTLWSAVESSGSQFQKAEATWMQILNHVDEVYGVPKGWHLITDILTEEFDWVPARAVREMKALYNSSGWEFGLLGLWPYEWDQNTDWEQVESYLKLKRMNLEEQS